MNRFLATLLLCSAFVTGLPAASLAQPEPTTVPMTVPTQYEEHIRIDQVTPGAPPAPQAQRPGYPFVADRRPFSLDANYMSLPGVLRFLVYQRDGLWMTRLQAAAVIDDQIATGE